MTSQPTAKKKKQSINRELIVGGGAIVLMFPLIALAVIGAVLGTIVGFALLSFTDVTAISALVMLLIYGMFTMIFGVLLWRITQRIRLLVHRKQDLKAEQERVANFVDTTSAVDRLKDQNLSSESSQADTDSITSLKRGLRS